MSVSTEVNHMISDLSRGGSHIDMVYVYVPTAFGVIFREIWYYFNLGVFE